MFVKMMNKFKRRSLIQTKKTTKKDKLPLKTRIKNHKFKLLLVELIKWVVIDIRRKIKYGEKLHLYGIRCITGMYGQGKTMAMTYLALNLRKKHGNNIYICSNFGLAIQDFPFTNIYQVSEKYDKPIIFMWDEVQNEFPATDKVFPQEVRKALTLNRKGNGKMYYWASQDHELVHKTIRRLTIEYGQVRTLFKRYTRIRWYRAEDYIQLTNEIDVKKRMKIHPYKKEKFIQDDNIRNLYNSYGYDNGEQLEGVSDIENTDNKKKKEKKKIVSVSI